MPRLVWPFLVSLLACGPQPGLQLSLTDPCEFQLYQTSIEVTSGSTFVGLGEPFILGEPFKVGVLVRARSAEYVPALSVRAGEVPARPDDPSARGFTPDRLSLTYKVLGQPVTVPPREVALGGRLQAAAGSYTVVNVLDAVPDLGGDSVIEVSMVAWGTNRGVTFFSNTVVFPIRLVGFTERCGPLPSDPNVCRSPNQAFDGALPGACFP